MTSRKNDRATANGGPIFVRQICVKLRIRVTVAGRIEIYRASVSAAIGEGQNPDLLTDLTSRWSEAKLHQFPLAWRRGYDIDGGQSGSSGAEPVERDSVDGTRGSEVIRRTVNFKEHRARRANP